MINKNQNEEFKSKENCCSSVSTYLIKNYPDIALQKFDSYATAKEAFENAFNTDAGKMNQFKAAVDEYYSRLLTIVSQYEQAESKNVSVGTTRTV